MSRNWRKSGGAEALVKGLKEAGGNLLFGDASGLRDTVSLRLADVLPNPDQPRRSFNDEDLSQLADSLRSVGQLSPILVKRHPTEQRRYLLVAGERRWRAAKIADMPAITAHILEEDVDSDRIALIENLQRVNLSPIEEAEGVQRLIDKHGYSQEQAGALLSRSRTEVNTTLTLLRLDPAVRLDYQTGQVDAPKALLLEIARMSPPEQRVAWEKARAGILTVREARAARRDNAGPRGGERSPGVGRTVENMWRAVKSIERGAVALEESAEPLSPDTKENLLELRRRLEECVRVVERLL
jgi:ParB family transcriptional regulator, chromosome partitioning protein